MKGELMTLLFLTIVFSVYVIELFISIKRHNCWIHYINILLLMLMLCLLIYFMLISFHIHLSLLNFIIWTLVVKEMKKIVNIKKMQRLINK